MNLRKEKAARLKFQVHHHTLRLIGKKSFDDLYVDDLCAKVKISKVTFFKYFPQKEDVLLYYFRIWCLNRAVELKAKPKEGLQGIYFLFDKFSEAYEEHPGLILSLISYLADIKRSPKPFPVKVEEKRLFFPAIEEINTIEMFSLDQLFEKFSLEAIFRKEITKATAPRDITNVLMTLFLGVSITIHMNKLSSYKQFFRRNLDLLFKGLQ